MMPVPIFANEPEDGSILSEELLEDSEEILAASIVASAVSAGLLNSNLNTSQENTIESSNGKRKRRRVEPCDSIERIADAMTRIASAYESRTAAIKTEIASGPSIGEVIAELQHIEAITSVSDWHSRYCQLMMFKPAREMFVALQENELLLLKWLKFAAYNPLPFKRP